MFKIQNVIKNNIKKILPKNIVNYIKLKRKKSYFKEKSLKDVFTHIKTINHWNNEESVSGPGSEISNTIYLKRELEIQLKELKIKSMLDIPCGDFNWMRTVNLDGVNYIGGDIVSSLIKENSLNFSNDNVKFMELDLTIDTLPQVDLIFCRDCLVHLSYSDIYKALINIKKSKSKYLLLTSFVNSIDNKNIITGEYRKLNMQQGPFYFSKPKRIIDEKYTKKKGRDIDKSMCLWEVSDIKISVKLWIYQLFSRG